MAPNTDNRRMFRSEMSFFGLDMEKVSWLEVAIFQIRYRLYARRSRLLPGLRPSSGLIWEVIWIERR